MQCQSHDGNSCISVNTTANCCLFPWLVNISFIMYNLALASFRILFRIPFNLAPLLCFKHIYWCFPLHPSPSLQGCCSIEENFPLNLSLRSTSLLLHKRGCYYMQQESWTSDWFESTYFVENYFLPSVPKVRIELETTFFIAPFGSVYFQSQPKTNRTE